MMCTTSRLLPSQQRDISCLVLLERPCILAQNRIVIQALLEWCCSVLQCLKNLFGVLVELQDCAWEAFPGLTLLEVYAFRAALRDWQHPIGEPDACTQKVDAVLQKLTWSSAGRSMYTSYEDFCIGSTCGEHPYVRHLEPGL